MNKNTELKALPRDKTGKEANRKLRAEGRIPAVLYGKDMDSYGLSLDLRETDYLFRRISVENTIVDLLVEGDTEPVRTLIREIQSLPHKPEILHVDFLRIQKGVAVELEIPVKLEGIPVGVRESGGVLEQMINELRVKCIPSLIPDMVVLDVAEMILGDSLHVSDVVLEEGVELLVDSGRTICNVAMPKVVVVEEEEEEEEGIEGEEGVEPAEGAEGADASDGDGE